MGLEWLFLPLIVFALAGIGYELRQIRDAINNKK